MVDRSSPSNAGVPGPPRSPSGQPAHAGLQSAPPRPNRPGTPRREPSQVASRRRLLAGYVALMATLGIAMTAVGSLAGAVATAQEEAPGRRGDGRGPGRGAVPHQLCARAMAPRARAVPPGPTSAQAGAALADFVLRTGRMPLADPNAPRARAGRVGSTSRTPRRWSTTSRPWATGRRSRRGRERRRRQPRPPAVRRELLRVPRAGGRRRRGRRRVRGPGLTQAGPDDARRGGDHGPRPDAPVLVLAGELNDLAAYALVPARRPASRRRHRAGGGAGDGGLHRGDRAARAAARRPMGRRPPRGHRMTPASPGDPATGVERAIGVAFLIAAIAGVALLGRLPRRRPDPARGVLLAICLGGIGFGITAWSHWLLPAPTVEGRHSARPAPLSRAAGRGRPRRPRPSPGARS